MRMTIIDYGGLIHYLTNKDVNKINIYNKVLSYEYLTISEVCY